MVVKFVVSNIKCQREQFIYQVNSVQQALEIFEKEFFHSSVSHEIVAAVWLYVDGNREDCIYCYYEAGFLEKGHPEMIAIDKYHLAPFFLGNVHHYEQLSLFNDPYWRFVK